MDKTAIRGAFGQTITAVRPLLADPALAARWEDPSALTLMPVRSLAGHLLRATSSVEAYLDRSPPGPSDGAPVSAAEYYARAVSDDDVRGPVHQAIRTRGEEAAAGGPQATLSSWDAASERLAARLAAEPAGRLVRVYLDIILSLDDYLLTRLVELCVHADDLAASLGRPLPPLPETATEAAVRVLVDVGRLRHGDAAVLRALARRERDTVGALRVL